jgi:hypothetical protein
MLRGYLADFNRHDARALASHWSDGAESIDRASGEATQGRGEVEEVFAALFRADAEATFDLGSGPDPARVLAGPAPGARARPDDRRPDR